MEALPVTNSVPQLKQCVDTTFDICRDAFIPKDHPEVGISGLGEEDVLVIFWLLLTSPWVPLEMDVNALDLSGIDSWDPKIAE